MIRAALFTGFAVVALSSSAFANCTDFKCPPPPCRGVKCYVINPLPTEKKAFSSQAQITPSIPIPPPRTRK